MSMTSAIDRMDCKLEFIECSDSAKIKCGDIFRTGAGSLTFFCAHCGLDLDSISTFAEHIEVHYNVSHLFVKNEFSDEAIPPPPSTNLKLPAPPTLELKILRIEDTDLDVKLPKVELNELTKQSDITPTIKCKNCTEMFKCNGQLDVHKQKHKQRTPAISCTMCAAQFPKITGLNSHIKTVHKNGVENGIVCTHCSIAFASEELLSIHRYPKVRKQRINKTMNETTVQRGKSYPCNVCNDRFKLRSERIKHICLQNPDEPYKCLQCPKSFLNKYHLDVHSQSHKKTGLYTCDLCQKTFSSKSYVKMHMQTSHMGEKPYQCGVCGVRIGFASQLRKHINRKHQPDNPNRKHLCDVCGKKFEFPYELVYIIFFNNYFYMYIL